MKLTITPKWGIRIFAAWALILALFVFANLLLFTQIVELDSNQAVAQIQVWIIFILNLFFGLGFAGSAYGLWQRHRWGRVLFLWTIVIWSGFSLITLFATGIIFSNRQYTTIELITNGIRHAVGLLVPLWYLNLAHVKTLF